MKTAILFLFATNVPLLAQLSATPQVVLGGQMLEGPVTGSPYSAKALIDRTQALADGNRIELHASSMRYRDGQGRERREEVLFGSSDISIVLISDPVTRTSYMLDQKARTAKKTGPLPPLPPPPSPHAASLGVTYFPSERQAEILKARGVDHGAFVGGVMKGSPAEKAGVQSGDIILAIDGQPLADSADLRKRIVALSGGSVVNLHLDRDGKKVDIPVTTQDFEQVFRSVPSILGDTPAIVYPPFVQPPPVDKSKTRTEDLGTTTIEGVLAQGKRSILTIPAGQVGNQQPIEVVSETWYSPELHTMVLMKQSDPRMGETVYRLTNINRAEPPALLFQVPPDYKITQGSGPNLILRKKD